MDLGNCATCNTKQESLQRTCPTCGDDLGFPNVRVASTANETAALDARLDQINNSTGASRASISHLQDRVDQQSGVVITVSTAMALQILNDPKQLYVNAERLIGAGAREPPNFANDAHRIMVSGYLYGSSGTEIVYGALSMNDSGLRSYGDIFLKLRDIAISKRTSFLEKNSYGLFNEHLNKMAANDFVLPAGHRATWESRGKLAAIKCFSTTPNDLSQNCDDDEIQSAILKSDGDRGTDDCIEAHICGRINIKSIERVSPVPTLKGANKRLANLVISKFIPAA
jgi:hypothetical protein